MTTSALECVKVLEYSRYMSGSYCSKLMADLGAEVIKIEQPGAGSEERKLGPFPDDIPHPEKSGTFLYLNTNKLGITLNLSLSTGRRIFERLLAHSDLFIHDNPPAAAKKLGLGYSRLESINPGHINVSITPVHFVMRSATGTGGSPDWL